MCEYAIEQLKLSVHQNLLTFFPKLIETMRLLRRSTIFFFFMQAEKPKAVCTLSYCSMFRCSMRMICCLEIGINVDVDFFLRLFRFCQRRQRKSAVIFFNFIIVTTNQRMASTTRSNNNAQFNRLCFMLYADADFFPSLLFRLVLIVVVVCFNFLKNL